MPKCHCPSFMSTSSLAAGPDASRPAPNANTTSPSLKLADRFNLALFTIGDAKQSHYSVLPFISAIRAAISALTASRLKLAARCIGGKSRNVWAYSPTFC